MFIRRCSSLVPLVCALFLLPACRGAENAEPGPQVAIPSGSANAEVSSAPEEDHSESARRDRAITALEVGEFETAHDLVQKILMERYLGEGRALIDAEQPNPQDGLLIVDKALEVDDRNTEALMLRARGNAILGQQLIERGSPGIYIQGAFEEALDAYEKAIIRMGNDVTARFGASRAAYNLLRYDDALRHARHGMQAISEGESAADLVPIPERTLAEVSYGAYTNALVESSDERRTKELFESTEEALNGLLGIESNDPWTWSTLANLYLWENRTEDAKAALKQGLDRVPDDASLLARLVDVSRSNGGLNAALLDINAFVNRHPDIAAGYWWLGRERFEVGLEKLSEKPPTIEDFEAAEQAFAKARELDPALYEDCLGYEVSCRNGIGWTHYNADNLEDAVTAFVSMNELFPRGVEWLYEGRMFSGIDGLDFVGFRYNERGDWEGAARTYELLRTMQPEVVNWANNAAFFHRDHAVELEQIGKDLCRRSFAPPTDQTEIEQLLVKAGLEGASISNLSESLANRAEEFLTRARSTIERSLEAYLDVERLAPTDVRLQNDAALVRVWYLYRDLDHARTVLEHCIEMGAEQIEDPSLSDDDREALENAWGDAYQNLGYLYLVDLKQGERARPYFEACVDLGDPRPIVTQVLLPMCDGDLEHPQLIEFRSWGRSCSEIAADREPTR